MSFDYFLGANTPQGFISYFNGMTDSVTRLFIIKGGPGCGKSTAMKRIADRCEAAGVGVHRIWCSSDTDSLDGIYFPALGTMYVDGTSPHVIEPNCPGARDGIVNFGEFWDREELESRRGEIKRIGDAVSRSFSRVYGYLAAAGSIYSMYAAEEADTVKRDKLSRRARCIISQNIPARRGAPRGRKIDIFANTLSPDGPVFINPMPEAKVCELCDGTGIYPLVTGAVENAALAGGYTVYSAHDPLFPCGAPLHIFIPELGFALLTSGGVFGCPPTGRRRIRLDMLAGGDENKSAAALKKSDISVYRGLIASACEELGRAKNLHDELEALYVPSMDFAAVASFCDRQVKELTHAFREQQSL